MHLCIQVCYIRFVPFQGILANAVFSFFFQNNLMVNTVQDLLQINEDYAIKKTYVNIDVPVIICLS